MLPSARCASFLLVPSISIHPGKIVAAIFLAVLVGSLVFCILEVIAATHYLRIRPPRLDRTEPISILKPLAGLDLDLESNLRTFFEQDYPMFEILLAVRKGDDPAASVARKLI